MFAIKLKPQRHRLGVDPHSLDRPPQAFSRSSQSHIRSSGRNRIAIHRSAKYTTITDRSRSVFKHFGMDLAAPTAGFGFLQSMRQLKDFLRKSKSSHEPTRGVVNSHTDSHPGEDLTSRDQLPKAIPEHDRFLVSQLLLRPSWPAADGNVVPFDLPTKQIVGSILVQQHEGSSFYSLEYFAPKSERTKAELLKAFQFQARNSSALFIDITWRALLNSDPTQNAAIELAAYAQQLNLHCNMHLTCIDMTKEQVRSVLHHCISLGIRNIMALRGDTLPGTETTSDFTCAADLVRFIREEYGQYFCISVAGYPNGNMQEDNHTTMQHLKEKVDAGADFVVSQMFYDAADFLRWEHQCREEGIKCPILPGILPIQSYGSLQRISKMCAAPIPATLETMYEALKGDKVAFQEFGIRHTLEICKTLRAHGVQGFHFYTMNKNRSIEQILTSLQLK